MFEGTSCLNEVFCTLAAEDDAHIPAVRLQHAFLTRGVPKHPLNWELRISQAVTTQPVTIPTVGFHPLVRVPNPALL